MPTMTTTRPRDKSSQPRLDMLDAKLANVFEALRQMAGDPMQSVYAMTLGLDPKDFEAIEQKIHAMQKMASELDTLILLSAGRANLDYSMQVPSVFATPIGGVR